MKLEKEKSPYEKTSFLQGNNSTFIEEMYLKYVKNPNDIPQSWKSFFDNLGEDHKAIQNEIRGPSWSPVKKNISTRVSERYSSFSEDKLSNNNLVSSNNYEKQKEQSVKAIALIRAYRIRGHLIANLDPLGMMERKYLEDLHPSDHGFKKEDYNKKI